MYKLTLTSAILRNDGAQIPTDSNNSDYAEYLMWVEQGNTADPADVITIPVPSIEEQIKQIEATQARAIREATLTGDHTRLKAIDDRIVSLRASL